MYGTFAVDRFLNHLQMVIKRRFSVFAVIRAAIHKQRVRGDDYSNNRLCVYVVYVNFFFSLSCSNEIYRSLSSPYEKNAYDFGKLSAFPSERMQIYTYICS